MNHYSMSRIAHTAFWTAVGIFGSTPYIKAAHNAPALSAKPPSQPSSINAKIIRCHDGDTCTALVFEQKQITLRLAGIDAPEISQTFSQQAKTRLTALTVGRNCKITLLGADVYARHLALIYCGDVLVNEALVAEGMAYAYINLQFVSAHFGWATRAETMARRSRLGIFKLNHAGQSPHQFRINKKAGARQKANRSPGDVWQRNSY